MKVFVKLYHFQKAEKCGAPLINVKSEMELVVKGTGFLKTHAASHGLKTRNRKRHEVARDISNHYIREHDMLVEQNLPANLNTVVTNKEQEDSKRGPGMVTYAIFFGLPFDYIQGRAT